MQPGQAEQSTSTDDPDDEYDDFGWAPSLHAASSRVPQSAQPRLAERAWAVTKLVCEQELLVCDESGMSNPSGWKLQCLRHTESQAECVLQWTGDRCIVAHDAKNITLLSVPRLRCRAHNSVFLLTSPSIFQQLLAKRLKITPALVVVSSKTVLLKPAYECVPNRMSAE